MKRLIALVVVSFILAAVAFGPASAQDNTEATISALQTKVAERGEKINAQRTQIAELRDRVSELEKLVLSPT